MFKKVVIIGAFLLVPVVAVDSAMATVTRMEQTTSMTKKEPAPQGNNHSAQDDCADQLIALVNQRRSNARISPVEPNVEMKKLALRRAIDVDEKDIKGLRYHSLNPPSLGGITARGRCTPAEIMEKWMNNKECRENILNRKFNQIGAVCYKEDIWVLEFRVNTPAEDRPPASQDKEILQDLSEYFQGYENATFLLYDTNQKQYTIHNKPKSEKRVSPNSTFKIPNSLIGLATGIVTDENTTFKWDGIRRSYEPWNQDHKLSSAIANSVVWYYQTIASNVGETRMQKYLDDIKYGNLDVSGGLTEFWLQSSLKISPREQIEFLRKFYYNQLPFSKQHVDIVKKIMVLQNENGVVLSGKTGMGIEKDRVTNKVQLLNSYFVGYVEKEGNTYFYATNIETDRADGHKAKEITLKILKDKGLLSSKIN